MKNTKSQLGFTLIEIFIAVAIIALLSSYAVAGLTGAIKFNAKIETKTRLDAWRSAIDKFYFDNVLTIDADATNQLNLGGSPAVVIPEYEPDATTKTCSIDPAKVDGIARLAGYAATDIVFDGAKHGFCMLITDRLSQTLNGATLYYHSIAVVSGGSDGVIDTGTSLSATGSLTLAGDDTGILFDGRKFSADRYAQTLANMKKIVSAYDTYYAARYQIDPNRSLSIDYFSCGDDTTCPSSEVRWDQGGEMISTCGGAISMNPATGTKPYEVLGLSVGDAVNGWGGDINVDNCTDDVRSPNNTNSAKQTPPYTAIISTIIPGGALISSTSVGQI